jgi:hypothetical protein
MQSFSWTANNHENRFNMCNQHSTNFCDFLDVPDRFQPHLDFTKCGHITGICGRCPQRRRLGCSTSETSPGKHWRQNDEMGNNKFTGQKIGYRHKTDRARQCHNVYKSHTGYLSHRPRLSCSLTTTLGALEKIYQLVNWDTHLIRRHGI